MQRENQHLPKTFPILITYTTYLINFKLHLNTYYPSHPLPFPIKQTTYLINVMLHLNTYYPSHPLPIFLHIRSYYPSNSLHAPWIHYRLYYQSHPLPIPFHHLLPIQSISSSSSTPTSHPILFLFVFNTYSQSHPLPVLCHHLLPMAIHFLLLYSVCHITAATNHHFQYTSIQHMTGPQLAAPS